jgi:phosphoserine aminotransferase
LQRTTVCTTLLAYSSKLSQPILIRHQLTLDSVYIAGQVLKSLLANFADKVDGQQAIADKKAKLIYAALDAHPESFKVVPDKSARSRMNICFRVTHVSILPTSFSRRSETDDKRVQISMNQKRLS